MLFMKEIAGWFKQVAGAKMEEVRIETVSITSSLSMPKGLYLPVEEHPNFFSGDRTRSDCGIVEHGQPFAEIGA